MIESRGRDQTMASLNARAAEMLALVTAASFRNAAGALRFATIGADGTVHEGFGASTGYMPHGTYFQGGYATASVEYNYSIKTGNWGIAVRKMIVVRNPTVNMITKTINNPDCFGGLSTIVCTLGPISTIELIPQLPDLSANPDGCLQVFWSRDLWYETEPHDCPIVNLAP
jgi:hypothetical protein